MKLRTRLFQLVVGTVVPLVLLAVALGGLLASDEQETFRDSALARIRLLMTAIDAELRGHVRVTQTLAASRSLAEGDLTMFYLDAQRALRSQRDWQNIMLVEPDGRQVLNLARPFGAVLQARPDMGSVMQVVETMEPAIGNVFFGENMGMYGVPVRVPVFDVDGQLAYVLTAVISPDIFGQLIRDQDLPESWVSGLIDATAHFVGRIPTLSHEDMASEDFQGAVRGSREGWYRGLTVERVDTYTAFKVSDVSQWAVGMAIPASVVNAGARNAAWIILLGTALSIAIAIGFAYLMGRRIARPITQLATSAQALGEGRPPQAPVHAPIREVREVANALNEAGDAIGERHALLRRERAALREADQAKDAFLAMLGHELRNPLGAITTAAQVLEVADAGTEMVAQSQAIIQRQARHMTRLIEDLLDISGLTMGKVTLKRTPFNLEHLARHVIRTWERTDEAREGRVLLEAHEVWVDGDRARIEQVLLNLLENATKFSPDDRPVHVAVGKDADTAVLRVTDEGEGIAEDQLEQVFGLFVQGTPGASAAARMRRGMGVGLALVRRLVELHGGTVSAWSEGPGKGATFTVRLPSVAAPADAEPDPSPSVTTRALNPLNILVTEDNNDAREMMESMLALDGHDVRTASSGSEALSVLAHWQPDVVLMDIGLPDMDGYEIAQRICGMEIRRRIKLIALTGFGQSEDEQRAYAAGFDLHLTKPVAPALLRKVLAAHAPANRKSDSG